MLQQTINEQLKAFDENFVSKGIGEHPEREIWGADTTRVKDFLSLSMRRAVEVALEETKPEKKNSELNFTGNKWIFQCVTCGKCYAEGDNCPECFAYNLVLAEQEERIRKFLEQ